MWRATEVLMIDVRKSRPFMSAAVSVAFAVLVSGVLPTTAWAQTTTPFHTDNERVLENYSAEYPPLGPTYSAMRGELMRVHTARLLRDRPTALETFEMLVFMERAPEAISVLRRIIETDPTAMARPFERILEQNLFNPARDKGVANPVTTAIEAARAQLARLPEADAAAVERLLVLLETRRGDAAANPPRATALKAFIDRHPNTVAAREAEIDIVNATYPPRGRIAPYDDIVKRYPGTTTAARALFEKAWHLSKNFTTRGQDSTDLFLQVFAIVQDLESGRYPVSDAVTQASSLIMSMRPLFMEDIQQRNVERLRTAYVDFIRTHKALPEDRRIADGISTLLNGVVFELFARSGDGVAGVESVLAELAKTDPARTGYLRGAFYISRLRSSSGDESREIVQRAHNALSSVASTGNGLQQRRALATLAELDFSEGDYATARREFASYLAAYPGTTFSWVAAIRAGQCAQLLGDMDEAIRAFRAAASSYDSVPIARTLGLLYAARASELTARFKEALDYYEDSLVEWHNLAGIPVMDYREGRRGADWPFPGTSGLEVEQRVGALRRSLTAETGVPLERGRLLMTTDPTTALALFDHVQSAAPQSPHAVEATRLSHQVRLRSAVALAPPESGKAGLDAAIAAIDTLVGDPWDEVIGAAKIVRATLLSRTAPGDAARAMTDALSEWRARQARQHVTTLPADVVKDVADIRRLIFEDEPAAASWKSSFEWPRSVSQVRLVNPDVMVSVGTARATRETIYQESKDDLLFMTSAQIAVLVDAINGLRGNNASITTAAPADLMRFISGYLPSEVSMLGGMLTTFDTIPAVRAVAFLNAERTEASVGIRTSSSGGTLRLEKQNGAWRVSRVEGAYIQ